MNNNLLQDDKDKLPEPKGGDGFSTESFLYGLDIVNITENDLKIIEMLCKKVEVPKRICLLYSEDLKRAVDKKPVSSQYVVFFTTLLLNLSTRDKDYKFFNCAMKIFDNILVAPIIEFEIEHKMFCDKVASELLGGVSVK